MEHYYHLGPIAFVWPSNQSRNTPDLIFPEDQTSILSPAVCQDSRTPPYLLVIVCSALQNFEARYSIRNSWAEDQQSNNVKVVCLVAPLSNKKDHLDID